MSRLQAHSKDSDMTEVDAKLEAIDLTIKTWLDWQEGERGPVHDGTSFYSVPTWPSRGQFKAWRETLASALAALTLREAEPPVAWRWRAKVKGEWGLWSCVEVDPNDWTWRDYWEDMECEPLFAHPASGSAPEGWNEAIEAAAKVAERDRETWHTITGNPCERIAADIRVLILPPDTAPSGKVEA